MFYGNLESVNCYYSRALNETMTIPFGSLTHCCKFYLKSNIFFEGCYLAHLCAQKYMSRRPDHTSNFHLQNEWPVVLSQYGIF